MALSEDLRPVHVVGGSGDYPDPVVVERSADDEAPTDSLTGSAMQVLKRDGSKEPVDLNKIVRAVGPLRHRPGPSRRHAGRHPDHLGSGRRSDHRGARRAVDPDRGGA